MARNNPIPWIYIRMLSSVGRNIPRGRGQACNMDGHTFHGPMGTPGYALERSDDPTCSRIVRTRLGNVHTRAEALAQPQDRLPCQASIRSSCNFVSSYDLCHTRACCGNFSAAIVLTTRRFPCNAHAPDSTEHRVVLESCVRRSNSVACVRGCVRLISLDDDAGWSDSKSRVLP